jgi:AcrR family transcriptional regulator
VVAEAYKSTPRASARRTSPNGSNGSAGRELRAQGRKTKRRLLDAGMRVFADRGFHAARVDDIVRAARTSHGTFYLYFAHKEDLLRTLALECASELDALADGLGPVTPDDAGYDELRRFLNGFFTTYRRYGPIMRAWMEGHVDDREASELGVRAFTKIARTLGRRMRDAGTPGDNASVSAAMACLERFAYFLVSRRLDFEHTQMLDTLTQVVHRGFFHAPLVLTAS